MINGIGLLISIVAIVFFVIIYIKKRDVLALYVVFMMLFLPKINIIDLSNNTSAGLRTDDILIFLFMLTICFVDEFDSCKKLFNTKVFKIFYCYFFLSIISFFIGEFSGYSFDTKLSFFTLIRKIEYFCFIFLGYDVAYYCKDNLKEKIFKCLNAFTIFTAIISVLQVTSIIGSFRFGSYDYGSFIGRAVGTFNGPYEIGAFFAITSMVYFYQVLKNKNKIQNTFYFILSLLIIVFSKSRISLIAVAALIVIMLFIYSKKKFRIAITISAVAGVILLVLLVKFSSIPMFSRFKTLSLSGIWNSLKYYIINMSYEEYIYTFQNGIDIEHYVLQTGDLSFNVRIFKWMAMVDVFFKFPVLGYGFGANSVIDGNYIKMLAENGIVGTILFVFALLVPLYKLNKNDYCKAYRWIICSVLIGSIFIDLFDASKIMEFVWFWAGLAVYQNSKEIYLYDKNIAHRFRSKCWWRRNFAV